MLDPVNALFLHVSSETLPVRCRRPCRLLRSGACSCSHPSRVSPTPAKDQPLTYKHAAFLGGVLRVAPLCPLPPDGPASSTGLRATTRLFVAWAPTVSYPADTGICLRRHPQLTRGRRWRPSRVRGARISWLAWAVRVGHKLHVSSASDGPASSGLAGVVSSGPPAAPCILQARAGVVSSASDGPASSGSRPGLCPLPPAAPCPQAHPPARAGLCPLPRTGLHPPAWPAVVSSSSRGPVSSGSRVPSSSGSGGASSSGSGGPSS